MRKGSQPSPIGWELFFPISLQVQAPEANKDAPVINQGRGEPPHETTDFSNIAIALGKLGKWRILEIILTIAIVMQGSSSV